MRVCVLLLALLCAVSLPGAEARLREGECEGPQATDRQLPAHESADTSTQIGALRLGDEGKHVLC
jgi:hypothetical protein